MFGAADSWTGTCSVILPAVAKLKVTGTDSPGCSGLPVRPSSTTIGAVGTLLKCHLRGRQIARSEDQRRIGDPGGGNVFVVRLRDRALLSDWVAMERLPEDFAV